MDSTTARPFGIIEVIRKRIQQFRGRREVIGEQNTKASLIDPLLSALGWDLQDFDEVRREYKRRPQDNPVDYAFFLNRAECLLLEAKSLEKVLSDRKWISQNISYAAVVGVKWCVLTNGDEYRIYNAHAEVDVEEKLFRKVCISEEPDQAFLTDTLMLLSKEKLRGSLLDEMWRTHFIDRKIRQAFESLLIDDDAPLIRALCKKAVGVPPSEARAALRRAKISIEFPLLRTNPEPVGAASASAEKLDAAPSPRRSPGADLQDVTISTLIVAGLIKPPMEVRRNYKGVLLTGQVQPDGTIQVGGVNYSSVSQAAGMARRSVIGSPPGTKYPATNGWEFWKYHDLDTGELRPIDYLRQMKAKADEEK